MSFLKINDDRTPEEKARIERESKLLLEYEEKLKDELSLECFPVDNEFWNTLERCIKENKKISEFYPGINDYDSDCIY